MISTTLNTFEKNWNTSVTPGLQAGRYQGSNEQMHLDAARNRWTIKAVVAERGQPASNLNALSFKIGYWMVRCSYIFGQLCNCYTEPFTRWPLFYVTKKLERNFRPKDFTNITKHWHWGLLKNEIKSLLKQKKEQQCLCVQEVITHSNKHININLGAATIARAAVFSTAVVYCTVGLTSFLNWLLQYWF